MSQVESKNAFPHKSPKNGLKNSPKIGLTAVSYHNTRPFLLGLQNHPISDQLDIQLDIPSAGGRKLASGVVSLGLVPVAVLNQLPNSRIITDWCIGADGPVKTVCLYGHQPIEKMDRIMLDYHSMTSVQLCKILVKEYWKQSPEFGKADIGYRDRLIRAGAESNSELYNTGALIIGDRSIGMESQFEYCYDLAQIWKSWTGLPFVFATWVLTSHLSDSFIADFNEALGQGIDRIDEIPELLALESPEVLSQIPSSFNLGEYLKKHISYNFDAAKKEGLQLFLEKIGHRDAVLI